MDAKNIKVGLNTLITLLVGIICAMSTYFILESDVKLQAARIERLELEQAKNEIRFKEVHAEYKELTKTLNQFKIDIIKAIHEKQHE